MFRNAHPLEVAVFWALTGMLFSFYVFIKCFSKHDTPSVLDDHMAVSKEIGQVEDIKRDRQSSREHPANSAD